MDCLAGTLGYIPGMVPAEQDFTYYNNRCSYFDRQDANVDPATVHFIGDSLIDGMDLAPAWPTALNRGIGGDTFRGVLNRVNRGGSANSIHRCAGVFINIGINDVFFEGDGSVANTPYMWDQLAPAMTGKWVVSHLLPVSNATNMGAHNGKTGMQLNACIDTINAHIDAIFAGNTNVAIVNVKTALAPNGYLDPVNTIDGLHLSKAGCDIWRPAIKAALVSLGL